MKKRFCTTVRKCVFVTVLLFALIALSGCTDEGNTDGNAENNGVISKEDNAMSDSSKGLGETLSETFSRIEGDAEDLLSRASDGIEDLMSRTEDGRID